MAETALLLAIRKIGTALANEATSQASQFAKYVVQITELQGSMGRIMRELRVIHDLLCQMNIQKHNNQVYEGWLEEVRKVVYVIEDMVDEYLHLVGHEQRPGCCFYLKRVYKQPTSLLSFNRLSSMVKETENNLMHLSEMKNRWVPIVNSGSSTNSSYFVEKSQHLASISRSLGEEDFVGIEENKETLIHWLTDADLVPSVIVLLGMGGLGKTALAAAVYKSERENFDCYAWVSISQTYTREDVLKRLIIELFKDKHEVPCNIATMDVTAIQETTKSYLRQKKYLIVLDDVWTPETYTDLSGALIRNQKGSRIIITTRIAEVAHFSSKDRTLPLKPLPDDKSWELFCKKAFPNHQCPQELEDLSKQILSKCKGLPLAIVSISSLLFVRDKTIEEWKQIHDQLSWELINNPRLDHVRNVLLLSLIYLPTYLKSCFLYCSLFPEDYLLKRKIITRLLVAEGFIEKRGESTLEEVAEGYLKELIHRNMLQLIETNPFGRVKSFRMHDIVRELAVDMCQKECFGVAYEDDKYGDSFKVKDERRVVIHKHNYGANLSALGVPHLRSIIVLDKGMPSSTLLTSVSKNSRYMSVLELSGLPIEKVPDAIGDLFNLRHLGLRGSKLKLLPKSIEKLSNLLTLDVCETNIEQIPGGIVNLKKLRHLFAEKMTDASWRDFQCRSGISIPKGLGNLTNLQTLQALEAQDESIRQLGELRQLRSIRVWKVKGMYCEHLCKSLLQMRFLSYLDLNASDENEVLQLNGLRPPPPNLHKVRLCGRLAEGMLEESPFFQTAGQNLYTLRLYWSQWREDPLPSLSRLSNLTELLFVQTYIGEELVFLSGWFPKLKTLSIGDLCNLKQLEIQQGTMTSLQNLSLVHLDKLMDVPSGLEFLTSLRNLHFLQITRDFLSSLQQCSKIQGIRWRYSLQD